MTTEIHLSRPGGQREGPYTLEQINRDLAQNRYSDADYWAWYEGLTEWVPLYSVPGVRPDGNTETAQRAAGGAGGREVIATPPACPAPMRSAEPPQAINLEISSGMPFSALKHIFTLTSGDGQAAMRSPIMARMLKEITSQDLEGIRQAAIPRDVIADCPFVEKLRREGAVPDLAWRAIASLNAELVQAARAGFYRICVRTFPVDKDFVALFLFYKK